MPDVAAETLLARTVAGMLATAGLGVYRADGSPYQPGGHALLVDQVLPTSIDECTLVTPFERVRAGRPIRGYVSEAVGHYIESNGLYR